MSRLRNIITSNLFSAVIIIAFLISVLFACEQFDPERIVKVETVSIANVEYTSCTASGKILDTGEKGIDQHGFCWSTAENPTTGDNKKELGPKNSRGSFSGILTGLSTGTTYYIRAYAQNENSIVYGEQKSFSTLKSAVPALITASISNITAGSAESGGAITDDGSRSVTERGVCWSTTSGPTTSDSKTTDGTGTGSYTSSLMGLSSNTRYYVRAYATNSVGTAYGNEVSFTTYSGETLTDYDGNSYQTIQIGNQLWMAENLRVTHYSDGTAIPLVEDKADWVALEGTGKAYCWYNNAYGHWPYGAIYTWTAAMNGAGSSNASPSGVQGVCPDGWHLPSDAEWKELEISLGMSQEEADVIELRGTDEGSQLAGYSALWDDGELKNDPAFGSSGFTARPAGARTATGGDFLSLGTRAYFWSATEADDNTTAYTRNIHYDSTAVYRQYYMKNIGSSVRCVKN